MSTDSTMKIAPAFEIKVALIGNVSAGKTTVLNALFRDKFGEVSMKRTTAGVNYFLISSKREWSLVSDSPRDAESILKEITEDNAVLRGSDEVKEKWFEIELEEDLCKMRKDTRLTIADIPGINEAGASNKYRDFVVGNWTTFDCVLVVMDGRQGVNTEEQVSLLHFVKKNLDEKKDIPVMILFNKIDDPDDEEQSELVCEARSEVERIFGVDDREKSLKELLDSDDSSKPILGGSSFSPVFIPISGITAFIFQCCSSMTLEKFRKFDDKWIAKLGRERIGKGKWKKLTEDQKIEYAYKAVVDPDGYKDGIEDSNFDKFLEAFALVVGGEASQLGMIDKQLTLSLESLSSSPGIVDKLSEVYQKMRRLSPKDNLSGVYQKMGLTSSEKQATLTELSATFWRLYKDMEEKAFDEFNKCPESVNLLSPLTDELIKYSEFVSQTELTGQSAEIRDNFKQLICRQIGTLCEKVSGWNYTNWTNSYRNPNRQSKPICWGVLSPGDWNTVLVSIRLLSYDKFFCQEFGQETAILDYWSMQHQLKVAVSCVDGYDRLGNLESVYPSFKMEFKEGKIISLPAEQSYHNRNPIPNPNDYFRIKIPSSLSDPNHFGHIAWKYCEFRASSEEN